MWFFRRQGKSSFRKLDAVVTGLIVGSAIAAVYGLKRRKTPEKNEQVRGGWLTKLMSLFKKK